MRSRDPKFQLLLRQCLSWFGLPEKVISTETLDSTSALRKSAAAKLVSAHNLSTSFHPQTDGLSERKIIGKFQSKKREQYHTPSLTTAQQNDWDEWLTIASICRSTRPRHQLHSRNDLQRSSFSATAPISYASNPNPSRQVPPNDAVESRLSSRPSHQKLRKLRQHQQGPRIPPTSLKTLFSSRNQVWLDGEEPVPA